MDLRSACIVSKEEILENPISFCLLIISVSIRFVLLLLIRKSITSLRKHIERVTDRLPKYHDHEDVSSTPKSPSLQHKDTTLESIVHYQVIHVLVEAYSNKILLFLHEF